ncbi:Mobile element protein [Candidatus Enterovibrio escicola]|uniref:Mobile element protein n=1 Tax=Candidatus Enterovibrio escicola TaxID=1927127 RepID=A0A2A5T250_9GAMM|nr:hypothetical protein [Candidatus Enterovibrio escacola]PCS22224.1 Mobile element protein [Candidatus Enterovibrio escacola]
MSTTSARLSFLHGEKYPISSGIKQRNKLSSLSVSEVMTIMIAFHQSGYRDFKTYYIHFICR